MEHVFQQIILCAQTIKTSECLALYLPMQYGLSPEQNLYVSAIQAWLGDIKFKTVYESFNGVPVLSILISLKSLRHQYPEAKFKAPGYIESTSPNIILSSLPKYPA